MTSGPRAIIDEIWEERLRQITGGGFTLDHDDEMNLGQLARAAACYALSAGFPGACPPGVPWAFWPWQEGEWKPTNERRNLVKAAALIVAEIERLDREVK